MYFQLKLQLKLHKKIGLLILNIKIKTIERRIEIEHVDCSELMKFNEKISLMFSQYPCIVTQCPKQIVMKFNLDINIQI